MPRSLSDFWPSSVRCIDQKHFPFQVFHLNHSFHLCLEHPVHKNKNAYAQDPDHFVTINCSLEDKGCDCIIIVMNIYVILTYTNYQTRNKKICDGVISLKECEIAVSKMKLNKSPGEDGLPVEFYKTF